MPASKRLKQNKNEKKDLSNCITHFDQWHLMKACEYTIKKETWSEYELFSKLFTCVWGLGL